METYSFIKILLYGFWMPLLVMTGMYFYLRVIFQRFFSRNKYFSEMGIKENIERMVYSLERELDRMKTALSNSLDSLSEELPNKILYKLSNQLEKEINRNFSNIKNQLAKKSIEPKQLSFDISSNESLIREMSHFLNTPLSQIEASLIAIEDTFTSNDDHENQLVKDINAVRSSVNMCKSFLAAYRELVLVAKSSKTWVAKSIKESLISASNLFMKKSAKNINVKLEISDTIKGYSNNYIISLLLPIIENAVESSSNNSEVIIEGKKRGNIYVIYITNVNENNIDLTDDIYKDGYTTKPNHEGMGLSIVKHLLSSNNKASISHKINGNNISFIIKLPVGE